MKSKPVWDGGGGSAYVPRPIMGRGALRRTARAFGWPALIIMLSGCAPAVMHPSEADVPRASQRWPGVTLAQLEQARSLYVSRCSACHRAYNPAEVSAATWPKNLDEMAPRAKLTADERRSIEVFVLTLAEGSTQKGKPQ